MTTAQSTTGARLKSFIERLENLDEEKREIGEQIKEVFAEAKGEGFDVKVMRDLLKLRKMKPHERAEREGLLEVYKAAIGMLDGTPLGEAMRPAANVVSMAGRA